MIDITSRPLLRLLVADPDPAMHALVMAMFHGRGFAVDIAGDGRLALDRLRRDHYDAVILDLRLPGIDGSEIVRELTSGDVALLARTIIVTAHARTADEVIADSPVRRVMTKPFFVDELVDEVLACVPGMVDPAFLPHEQRVH